MRILGIDPGYDRIGIAIIENGILIFSECFITKNKDTFHVRLKNVGQHVNKIIKKYSPDVVALESLFITKNQKTAMRVAETRGVISYEACLEDIPIYEYSPPQIKLAVTGYGRSDKSHIIRMVPILLKKSTYKISKNALDDEYDAIAIALTCDAYEIKNYQVIHR